MQWAALTLIQSYLAAGKPAYTGPTLRSFGAWSALLGGILDHAGIPGFLANWDELYQAENSAGRSLDGFVATWWAEHGAALVSTAQLLAMMEDGEDVECPWELNSPNLSARAVKLGKKLRQELKDRQFRLPTNATVAVRQGEYVSGTARWRLELLPPTPTEDGEG